jgi:hypothetical protein
MTEPNPEAITLESTRWIDVTSALSTASEKNPT